MRNFYFYVLSISIQFSGLAKKTMKSSPFVKRLCGLYQHGKKMSEQRYHLISIHLFVSILLPKHPSSGAGTFVIKEQGAQKTALMLVDVKHRS